MFVSNETAATTHDLPDASTSSLSKSSAFPGSHALCGNTWCHPSPRLSKRHSKALLAGSVFICVLRKEDSYRMLPPLLFQQHLGRFAQPHGLWHNGSQEPAAHPIAKTTNGSRRECPGCSRWSRWSLWRNQPCHKLTHVAWSE